MRAIFDCYHNLLYSIFSYFILLNNDDYLEYIYLYIKNIDLFKINYIIYKKEEEEKRKINYKMIHVLY